MEELLCVLLSRDKKDASNKKFSFITTENYKLIDTDLIKIGGFLTLL